MFAGFNLKTDEEFSFYKNLGNAIFNNNKNIVEEGLKKFMLGDGSIDGTEMQNNWFPQIVADIFISHSHADKEKAIALAGWLNCKFGLNVFIDSCVWGFSDNLLKQIDDVYCKNPGSSYYSYEKRNFSTSHVHMMLSTALSMMIDKTECVLFLNTPNSIDNSEVINQTKSPWIYYEIGMTQLVRKKEPNRPEGIIKKELFENNQSLDIKYNLDMKHLQEIVQTDLQEWEKAFAQNKERHPLDHLYVKNKLIKSIK